MIFEMWLQMNVTLKKKTRVQINIIDFNVVILGGYR